MRQILGLKNIHAKHPERLNAQKLAEILLNDFRQCRCYIYGTADNDSHVVLAELALLPETLVYDNFDQRIDFVVSGAIIRCEHVPLTYRLQAENLVITGRCSMIPRVCGVDLYLQQSYSGIVGDIARQKFSILVKPLLKMLTVMLN
jgi:hypothetical protein